MTRQLLPGRVTALLAPLLAALLLAVPAVADAAPAAAQALLHTDHPLVGTIWDPRQRRAIDRAELLRRAADADVLLLGETHDNPVHHRHQQAILQSRIDAGAEPALLLEQFDTERQGALDAALAEPGTSAAEPSGEARIEAAIALSRGWDWSLYRPLLGTAIERRLPVVAANFSRERLRPIIRQGFAAFDADELKRLGVEGVWNERLQQYVSGLMEKSHCGQINPELRDGLVKGQRVRDAVMADAALLALRRVATRPGKAVVGIVGRGHARRDVGIPLYLADRAPQIRVLSVGMIEVSPELASPEAYEPERPTAVEPYDLVWFTPRAERADPCASFGKK